MGQVDARLPLALLRAIQRQDEPPELLPDEPAGSLFPKRLGLSDVIEDQIRQFERLARRRRGVEESQVTALIELIVRRMDAAAVLSAAGEELARSVLRSQARFSRRLSRSLPVALRRRATARALKSTLPGLLAASRVQVGRSPLEVRTRDSITARVGSYSGACQLVSTTISTAADLFHVDARVVTHSACQRHGAELCVWTAEAAQSQ